MAHKFKGDVIIDKDLLVKEDLIIDGDLTVNGDTTTINTQTLNVEDANISVNVGGDETTADTNVAGITVEMSDATNARVGFDSTSATKFKVGEVGSESPIVSEVATQTLENKTIDGTSASGNNVVTTDADQVTYERADGSKKNIQASSDEVEAALSDLDDAIGALDATPANYTPVDAGIVADHLAAIDAALAGAGTDELVKISSNDTTGGYLEDKIVTPSAAGLAISTLNDGGNEDLQIALDINGATAETSVDEAADKVIIYDASATANKSMLVGNLVAGRLQKIAGDIDLTSFVGANDVSSPADVTGLLFNPAVSRSFKVLAQVVVDATADLFEVFELMAIYKGTSWDLAAYSTGDESGVVFSITNAGQVQYTSDDYAGFTSLTIKFRAITLSI